METTIHVPTGRDLPEYFNMVYAIQNLDEIDFSFCYCFTPKAGEQTVKVVRKLICNPDTLEALSTYIVELARDQRKLARSIRKGNAS